MRYSHLFVLLFALTSSNTLLAADDDHDDSGHDESGHEEGGHSEGGHEEEEGAAELSEIQISTAGIETIAVQHSNIADVILAPGEVTLNAYRTAKVTPRIKAQIVQRHARLGDTVTTGQALVTLSSIEVAQAQGDLLVSDREWKRVKKLGRKVVSERRYVEAQVARQQAHAKLRAYGMTDVQVKELLQQADASRATGELVLLSPQQGTVIHDNFIIGELAEPGRELFIITDETTLWVDARLTPEDAANVHVGAAARVNVSGRWMDGEVTQAQHVLDERTRTLPVRIQIANPDDQLHPGQFVSVEIQSTQRKPGIAVPVAAVLRSPDGDWQVFIEEAPGRYEPKEIEVLRTVGRKMVIDGLKNGERIVSKGAFFIQSEIAKGGFEIHNH